jgi:FeS assembly SUF system protein
MHLLSRPNTIIKNNIMEDSTNYMDLEMRIIDALKTVYDPEIPVNIYDLGLIYKIDVKDDNSVLITMTLTNPNCPVADTMPNEVKEAVEFVEGIKKVDIKMVFEPEWNKDMMSEAAMLELGLL